MNYLYILLLFLLPAFTTGQSFYQSSYGDTTADLGNAVISTPNGYCIVGSSGSDVTDSSDIAVYTLDQFGNLLVSTKIGSAGNEFPSDLETTSDFGFIITGNTYASPLDTVNSDIFIIRISDFGFLEWAKVISSPNDDHANSILKTPEGHFVISGSSSATGGNKSAVAIKIDEDGNILWMTSVNASASLNFNSSALTTDQKYVFAGYAEDLGNYDHYIAKLDTNGTFVWGKQYATSGSEWIEDITSTNDNHFVCTGVSTSNTSGDTDQAVLKTDSSGSIIWAGNFGTPLFDIGNAISETNGNTYMICGTSNISSVNPLDQLVLHHIDSSGSILWSNSYGSGTEPTRGNDLIEGIDGGYAASGFFVSFSDPNGDAYFVKTEQSGISGCLEAPISFSKISTTSFFNVSSAGNSSVITFTDSLITPSERIFIDQFSQNCFSDNIDEKNSPALTIGPNPVNDLLHISSTIEDARLFVTDISGKILLNGQFSGTGEIDIRSLSPGSYLLKLFSDDISITRKFIRIEY